jgi:hypothetical protein
VRIEQPRGHSVLAGDERDDRIGIGRCHVCALPRIGSLTSGLRPLTLCTDSGERGLVNIP